MKKLLIIIAWFIGITVSQAQEPIKFRVEGLAISGNIDVQGDSTEVNSETGQATITGNATVKLSHITLTADVFYLTETSNTITAEGNAKYTDKDRKYSAEKIELNADTGQVIIFGADSPPPLAQPETESIEAVELSWHTDETSALEEAEKLNRPIFIFFTAEWCAFCHEMEDETLKKPEASRYLTDNFVLLKADYDNSKDLVARYRIQGVPAMVIGDPKLKVVEQTSGFMPLDVFMAWANLSAQNISPEAIAEAEAEANKFFVETSKSFREGLDEEQLAAINQFYQKCTEKDPKTLEFAKDYLTDEIQFNPGRFSGYLQNEKLHIRILTANAFAKLYGDSFHFDPWDMSLENQTTLVEFLKQQEIPLELDQPVEN